MNKARGCFITILIIFILVVFVFLFVYLMDSDADGNGKDILILGIDEREGRNDFKGRTDTIIIYHISSWGKKDSLISIPRDTRVQLEGYGWNKINAAYVYGGEEMIKQEIYELTGIEIDRVMIINFNGFKRIIDILGGIEIVVEEPLHDELSGADFDPGTYTMSGEQALSFARCRATARADIDRIDRQQYLLNEIIRQKFNFSMITKMPQIIKVLSSETRSDFTIWDFCSTGFVLLFSSKDINRIMIPTKSAMIDDVSYQIADEDEVKEFLSGYLK
ncbi:Polyisoprenyl-teichoic acid--peptidoglycan teichoic acid transferase TagU [subsurface metagenome]|nr:hypothetical protein [Clostridia bacterium]